MENPLLAEPQQMRDAPDVDVEAQSAPCKKSQLPTSCDAAAAAACTSGNDVPGITTSELDDAGPFCIRGYVAAVREINISKCWPFSRHLLEESIREGKHPLLPPLSPNACVVKVIPEYYLEAARMAVHEVVDEACGANDGPQLQVQIDLSKFEAELDSHGCAPTIAPSEPLNPSLEAAKLQEPQAPCESLLKVEEAKNGSPMADCPLVFKRQAPRSIREIRNSLMQGCQCFKGMGVTQACRKDSCSQSSTLPTCAADIEWPSLDASEGLKGLGNKGVGDRENVSGITQLEPFGKTHYESQGVAHSHGCSILHTSHKTSGEMENDFNDANKQSDPLAVEVPLISRVDACENAALGEDMRTHTRSENANRRFSVSDSQSVDKSHESHNLKSSNSRQCWDTAMQQGSPDTTACLDIVPQQTCPVCLLFQSSSNTALNVHIDRCLAASSMEGTAKSKQKVKVRKKRSIAELFLVVPPNVVGGENTNENTLSDCNIKSQKVTKKAAAESRDKTTRKQNEVCEPKSKVNTLKLLQWGSRSSCRHGASRRGPIHEARIPSIKNQSFQGRAPEWRTTSVFQNTRNWKHHDSNHHEQVAARPLQNVKLCSEEKAQRLRKLLQRNKRTQSRILEKDANQEGNSVVQQPMTAEASIKLRGTVLPKSKRAALRAALLRETNTSRASKESAHVLTSDTHLTVIGPRETTVEVLDTDDQVNAEVDQSDKTKEKVKFRVHIHPNRKHNNKPKQKIRDDLQEALDLQLAIIKIPPVSQKARHAECQSVRPGSPLQQNPIQERIGIAEASLKAQVSNQHGQRTRSPQDSRAEEQPGAEQSLPLLSGMMEDSQGEDRRSPNCRKVRTSAPHNDTTPCLTCNVLQANKRGVLTCFRDVNDIDISLLPLGAQPKSKMSLRNHSAACAHGVWNSRQTEKEQIQMSDSQQPLSTTSPNNNSISVQQFTRFPFSLSTKETPWWHRQFEERNFLTAGSEGLNASVPSRFIQSPGVAKRTLGTSLTSQDLAARQENLRHDNLLTETGRQFTVLQTNAEAHQFIPGSNPSTFHKDACSMQIPSFPGSSHDHAWQQQHNHSQRLPPWMEAAIHDQRSPAFSSMGLSINSSCQSHLSNTTPNISQEMSRTLSMFEMIGSPVLRLMGKTMVLMPEGSQGRIDPNTGQLSDRATYINFFQSLQPEQETCEPSNHLNRSQAQNLQMQPDIHVSSDSFNCSNKEMQSWTSDSHSTPQLQDFFHQTPSLSQIPPINRPANHGVNMAERNLKLLQESSQLLSAMSHRAQLNWQHQKSKNPSPFWPQSSPCSHSQKRPHLEFSEGTNQCNSFRSNSTIPQAPRNSTHTVCNAKPGCSSNFSSWLSSTISRANIAHQPTKVIILDEEGPLCSFNTSISGPSGQGIAARSKRPEASAAQHNNSLAECRAKLADLCQPAREKPKEKTFIPIIYTVGGSTVESQIWPGGVGPKVQKSVTTAHESRQVKNYGTAMNSRKRAGCFEQPGDNAKHLKTSEIALRAPNASNVDHGKACGLGLSEPGNCPANQIPSINTLRAASERMQSMAHGGSMSVLERLVAREPSSLRPGKDVVQVSNVSKERRSHAPNAIEMCSTNMNPAEVDCQDAGQFTLTPALDMFSESSPVHTTRACMDMNVSMCAPSSAPTQEPTSLKQPLSSATVSTALPCAGFPGLPSATNLTSHQDLLSHSLNKKAASKKSSLPKAYGSSKPPTFCITVPVGNRPCPSQAGGSITHEYVSPTNQPGRQASTIMTQDMLHSFKAARKFVIMNGRVSIMDTQRNKDLIHENIMHVQKGERLMRMSASNAQMDEELMHSNQLNKEVRDVNGRNQHVSDAERQQYVSVAEVPGNDRDSARGGNDKHEAAGTTAKQLTDPGARPANTVCESR